MSKETPLKVFAVVYRSGGTKKCMWQRMLGVFTREQAIAEILALGKMGYHAIMPKIGDLEGSGMPIGWDWRDVDHTLDQIEVGEGYTKWTHRDLLPAMRQGAT